MSEYLLLFIAVYIAWQLKLHLSAGATGRLEVVLETGTQWERVDKLKQTQFILARSVDEKWLNPQTQANHYIANK